ncbi:MAG: hypothetical protein HQ559_06905 [Lentisphaerae bacterium]|nr:hypothetical protein [Lentisphaerota bacterium]
MHQTNLVGNNLPISVFGTLALFLLIVNPALGRVSRRLVLSGGELAVVLGLTLAACCIPGSGLMRTFPSSLVLPHHYNKIEAGWQDQHVMDLVPEQMLVDTSGDEDGRVVNGFLQGMGVGSKHIAWRDVPWHAWARPMLFWLPLILALWLTLAGLSLVVHRQWARHEQLAYPVAQFVSSLLPEAGRTRGSVFSRRLFWWGLGTVLLIHLNNYAATWFPAYMVQVPLSFNFTSLGPSFPTVQAGGGTWWLFQPRFYMTVVAFAFFLASDVSLSLGIGPIVFAYVAGLLALGGISLSSGGYLGLKLETFLNFGSYLGLFLAILYTGRHYYGRVFRQAVGLGKQADLPTEAVWGARVAILAFILLVASMAAVGLDWPLAVLYAAGLIMIFLGMSRVIAETGLFFMQPYTFPCVIIWGVFGPRALGPQTLFILLMITSVLLVDPRESLMPFLVNALKTVDLQKGRIGAVCAGCVAALLVGLAVAIPTQLYLQYDRGTNMADGWANRAVPLMPFEGAVRTTQRLDAQDMLESSQAIKGWRRFAAMAPDKGMLGAFAVGISLVLVFTGCRLRFPKWPLHPIMFIVWTSYPGKAFAWSFLAGCLIKSLVIKYGGPAAYQKLKPLMFGLIAGEMLGGTIPALVGLIYYLITGEVPKSFSIMPG